MLSTLKFLGFRNYYNRKVGVASDEIYSAHTLVTVQNYNFVPGDGITAVAPNLPENDGGRYNITDADYLVIYENGIVKSRWFVMECKRELKGFYTATLRRDIVSDNLTSVLNSKAIVERGMVNALNPAIYNGENVTFNQIKTKEIPLKDDTGCSWIVGYYNKGKFSDSGEYTAQELTGTSIGFVTADVAPDTTVANKSDWAYNKYIGANNGAATKTSLYKLVVGTLNTYTSYAKYFTDTYTVVGGAVSLENKEESQDVLTYYTNIYPPVDSLLSEFRKNVTTFTAQADAALAFDSAATVAAVRNLNNTTLKVTSENKLYRVKVSSETMTKTVQLSGSLRSTVDKVYTTCGYNKYTAGATDPFVSQTVTAYYIELEPFDILKYKYNITANRVHTVDQPYDIFAIPYSDTFKVIDDDSTDEFICSKKVALDVVNGIISKYGGNNPVVYDVQLLPICPFKLMSAEYRAYSDSKDYSYITDSTTPAVNVGIIFNVSSSQISTTIAKGISVEDTKIENSTTFCRLVSPNNNGIFEFTPAKNNGVEYFTIDMALKPFTPYIHCAPNWGGLYGQDFNDPRGLICGGDFGLTMVSDAWQTYKRQNANYLNSFNRNVESMELNNSVAGVQDWASAVAGSFQTSAAGFSVGGGWGAAIGGIVGLGAGITDAVVNEKLRRDELDNYKTQFKLQMGNIQALPQGLTRVDTLNPNYKEFIIVEIYDCTDEEKLSFANRIKYQGMTINRVGKIGDYVDNTWKYSVAGVEVVAESPFVQGIIYEVVGDLLGDDHALQAIAEEIKKGVYIEKWQTD